MEIVYKVLEKLLISLLSSLVLFIAAFSMMTGKFPPKGSDLVKVAGHMKTMYTANQEVKMFEKNYATVEPNLEQMVELQRISLKRTEAAFALSKIMVRFPQGAHSVPFADKINKISYQLEIAASDLEQLRNEVIDAQKMSQIQSSGGN